MCPRNDQIFQIKLFPNITTLFYRSQLHVPLMSRIEGGGQDTMAWVSWPPLQTFVFEIIRNSVMCTRNAQIFRIKLFPNITTLFYLSLLHVPLYVRNTVGGQDTVAWVSWPPPQTFVFEIIRNSVMCPRNAQIFRIKLFPNITTLFYRSQLHVPLYVRNRGWGSRYHGLGILTLTPDDCFWNYKKFSNVSKKCSDIFESNCFLT